MSQELEDLIRTAQLRVADAADPGGVREGIATRAARLRVRRTIGTVAAAAAAVIAVALAVPLSSSTHRSAPIQPPSASPTTAAGGSPLRYRIMSLPTGFVEKGRIVADPKADNPQIEVVRTWTADPVGANAVGMPKEVRLFVLRKPDATYYDRGTPVDVNGTTGYYDHLAAGPSSTVSWPVGDQLLQVVAEGGLDPTQEAMLRMARSVRPDPATTRAPLWVSWLPSGYTLSSVAVSGDWPAEWQCSVFATTDPQDGPDSRYSLNIRLATGTPAPEGGPLVMVGGRPGRILDNEANTRFLVVNVDDLLLTVWTSWPAGGTPMPDEDLIHVATATVRLGDPTTTAWIGSP